ncbi:hypothetical protein KC320_g217 [Hortaea werneckii]|nr:hypothetical protein KC320_g217 [Hortaea werneckii]
MTLTWLLLSVTFAWLMQSASMFGRIQKGSPFNVIWIVGGCSVQQYERARYSRAETQTSRNSCLEVSRGWIRVSDLNIFEAYVQVFSFQEAESPDREVLHSTWSPSVVEKLPPAHGARRLRVLLRVPSQDFVAERSCRTMLGLGSEAGATSPPGSGVAWQLIVRHSNCALCSRLFTLRPFSLSLTLHDRRNSLPCISTVEPVAP